MKDCVSCVHEYLSPMSGTCRECGIAMLNYKEAKPKPTTNYDRLRAKSVEEMAEFMNCGACPPGKDVTEICYDKDGGSVPYMCDLCWLNWLKQEADG